MSEKTYTVSQAARVLQLEGHVLRFWEEELGLAIKRNDKGHRVYTEENMQLFHRVQDLKKQGYQLKEIRRILSGEEIEDPLSYCQKEDRQEQFYAIVSRVVTSAIAEGESEEGRYREVDRRIRSRQRTRKKEGHIYDKIQDDFSQRICDDVKK